MPDSNLQHGIFVQEDLISPRFKAFLAWSLVLHVLFFALFAVKLPFQRKRVKIPPGIPVEVIARPQKPAQKAAPKVAKSEPVPKSQPTSAPATRATIVPTPEPVKDEPTVKPKEVLPTQPKRKQPPKPTPKPKQQQREVSWLNEESQDAPEDDTPKNPAIVPPEQREEFKEAPGGIVTSGSVSFDEPMEYDYYLSALTARVSSNWFPRPGYLKPGSELTTVIYFRIDKGGKLLSARIEESCGKSDLDQEALRAVKLSDPFPPLPPAYSGGSLGVHFAFYLHK